MKPVRLGCIGCGQMGAAILRGLAEQKELSLVFFDTDAAKAHELERSLPGSSAAAGLGALVERSEIIILAVKPQHLESLLKDLAVILSPTHLLLSIAAGVSIKRISDYSGGQIPVVRVMPNTGLLVRRGLFALCFDDPKLNDEQKENIQNIFAPLGKSYILPEKMFDAFTATAGSGPAYVYYLMEALAQAAVHQGFPRAMAVEMARELVIGAGLAAEKSGQSFSELREAVESPAGTTIAATQTLDRLAVRAAYVDAVTAAAMRSAQLAGKIS